MSDIIILDKSLQDRLVEFEDLEDSLSSIRKQWETYLEFNLCRKGWQAVWKIPRVTCEVLNIPFPSIALVLVVDTDIHNLKALVKILGVEDESIHLSDMHVVPLIQLWVTKTQNSNLSLLSVNNTANALDVVRFFYTKLYMPWDAEDLSSTDWKDLHLEPRLRLHYEMRNGITSRATAEHINSLLTEARNIQARYEMLEELGESENEELIDEMNLRMLQIKNEMLILENPHLRKIVIKRENVEFPLKNEQKQFWAIQEKGTVEDHVNFLTKVKQELSPSTTISVATNLTNTLEIAKANSTFILKESNYCIKSSGALEIGGRLIGVSERHSTVITTEKTDIMWDFIRGNVELKNITISVKHLKCVILVRTGKTILKNVKIIGNGASTSQGIIVLPGAVLELFNCEIENFSSAITGNAYSNISLTECNIHDVDIGLKILDNCLVNLTDSTINNCKQSGIIVESTGNIQQQIGNFELLDL